MASALAALASVPACTPPQDRYHLTLPGTADSSPNGSPPQHSRLEVDLGLNSTRSSSATPSDLTARSSRASSNADSSRAVTPQEGVPKLKFTFATTSSEDDVSARVAEKVKELGAVINLQDAPPAVEPLPEPAELHRSSVKWVRQVHERDETELAGRSYYLYLLVAAIVAVVVVVCVVIKLYG